MLRSFTARLFGVALTLTGFGLNVQSAVAQTTYTFDATYDAASRVSSFISENITANTVSGESNDAPFGLTRASGLFYIQNDLTSGSYRFSSNPATFDLEGLPLGGVTLFGVENNKLFYSIEDGIGFIDFNTLTTTASNTATIIGGEGLFSGATGTLTSSEVNQVGNLLVDPRSTIRGTVRVSGIIQVSSTQRVPEPTNTAALIGISAIGVGLCMCKQRRKVAIR
ncbi:hypothetical protein [Iningainema tapete]|uniref:PEP-CTERM protein-sorting domain-containing protein n=1 Tax=Iningainema tapete BLCC-T55 TaxID=2748662 RepID=A0A8J6XM95_9CYAN|nr:hypothetical protein [Iningainema tapete]MBD2774334.1 hypothetical protein [Iningainema tapete BLCC-T55]